MKNLNIKIIFLNLSNSSRKNKFGLIVALDSSSEASGELFWDDGVSNLNLADPNYYHFEFSHKSVSNFKPLKHLNRLILSTF